MKTVDHLQLPPEILFREVIQHPGVDQALHERGPVLRQAERREPRVADPLVVHVAEGQGSPRSLGRRRRGQRHHLLYGEPELEPMERVADADLALDLRVAQGAHYGARFDVGSTGSHVPKRRT